MPIEEERESIRQRLSRKETLVDTGEIFEGLKI